MCSAASQLPQDTPGAPLRILTTRRLAAVQRTRRISRGRIRSVTDYFRFLLKVFFSAAQPIVTQIVPLKAFYRAENYHQDCAALHPNYPCFAIYELPKVKHLKQEFPRLYVANP